MNNFYIFLMVFFLVLILIGVSWIIVIFFTKDEEIKNLPFLINFMSNFADGSVLGLIKSRDIGKDDRVRIIYTPLDIPIEDIDKVPDKTIWVEKNKLIDFSKTQWSRWKNIVVALPSEVSYLPEALKKTEFGAILAVATEVKNSENTEIAAIREGSNRKTNILKRQGDGELSREDILKMDEFVEDMLKVLSNFKNKEKTYTTPGFGNIGQPGG